MPYAELNPIICLQAQTGQVSFSFVQSQARGSATFHVLLFLLSLGVWKSEAKRAVLTPLLRNAKKVTV